MNEESELSWEQIKQAADQVIFAQAGEHSKTLYYVLRFPIEKTYSQTSNFYRMTNDCHLF